MSGGKKYLIVLAHHEPKSLNHSFAQRAQEVLTAAGNEVKLIDLHAINFNPVSDRRNFKTTANPEFLKQQIEERHATEHDGFADDIKESLEAIDWCDVLILQFPFWWFSMPAILKGWIDKVWASGRVYGPNKKFTAGVWKGKKAFLSITTGSAELTYAGPDSRMGDINSLLFPINHGILAFVGFTVLPPFIAYSASHATEEQRKQFLDEYEQRLLSLESLTPISYPPNEAFESTGLLKADWKAAQAHQNSNANPAPREG